MMVSLSRFGLAFLFLVSTFYAFAGEGEGEVVQVYSCDEGWWLLGAGGETLATLDYPYVCEFVDGRSLTKLDEEAGWGVIDIEGTVLLRTDMYFVGEFSGTPQTAIAVRVDPETEVKSFQMIQIDETGTPVCSDLEGAGFSPNENFGPIAVYRADEGGEYLVRLPTYEPVEHEPCHTLMKVWQSGGLFLYRRAEGEPLGLMDSTGRVLTPPLFRGVGPVSEAGIISASPADSRLWGYIDVNDGGRWVIEPQWIQAGNFVDGVAAVRDADDACFLIEDNGTVVVQHDLARVGTFRGGIARARGLDETTGQFRYGYINENAEWVVPPRYLRATEFNGRSGAVRSETELIVLDAEGAVLNRREQEPIEGVARGTGLRP